MKIFIVFTALVGTALSLQADAPVTLPIFSDDFESGTLAQWTPTATIPSPLVPSTAQNIVPPSPDGQWSAYMDTSLDRMHHNIIADNGGTKLSGHSVFTSWLYDTSEPPTASRIYNEVRGYSDGTGLPNGGTNASGTLAQLLAIGKYNSVTLPGEFFNISKYQGRVTFPAGSMGLGWFNLDGPGSPNRSPGWHRFDIERLADGTTINFYVDEILSRTITGATPESWDTVILGPGLGSTVGDAWIDGVAVGSVTQVFSTNLSIGRFSIDGGGGTSSNGTLAVRGAIGQPDAGLLSDSRFTIKGGFWAVTAVQTTGAPLLTIILTPTNTVKVSWPSPSTGFDLQQNSILSAAGWSMSIEPVTDDTTNKCIIVNPPVGNRFYRLVKP